MSSEGLCRNFPATSQLSDLSKLVSWGLRLLLCYMTGRLGVTREVPRIAGRSVRSLCPHCCTCVRQLCPPPPPTAHLCASSDPAPSAVCACVSSAPHLPPHPTARVCASSDPAAVTTTSLTPGRARGLVLTIPVLPSALISSHALVRGTSLSTVSGAASPTFPDRKSVV